MRRFYVALAIWTFGLASASAAGDCATPVAIEAPPGGPVQPFERVEDYQVVLKSCQRKDAEPESGEPPDAPPVVAIREMIVDREKFLLTVDPKTLVTRLERGACWTCGATDVLEPELEKSRYMLAVRKFANERSKKPLPPGANWLENAGLTHGQGVGAFVTGDLCPSHLDLDRTFFRDLELAQPVALSITGFWVDRHRPDFLWLRQEKAAGRLKILWVNHSFSHPFHRNLSNSENFILTPGLNPWDEIFNVERLLIANGETPSVFFRFPGLISNAEWMRYLREASLIPLGADAWLALGQIPKDGGIVLVHPNGNEPAGIADFKRLHQHGAIPKPFRPLEEAP
jgi:hypothetical protein